MQFWVVFLLNKLHHYEADKSLNNEFENEFENGINEKNEFENCVLDSFHPVILDRFYEILFRSK